MKHDLHTGDYVVWKWSNGYGHGKITSIDHHRVEITSKGKTIARNGSRDDPAVTITDHNDTQVLKLASELEKAD